MASTWGTSWGTSWGDSWGTVGAVAPAASTIGGGWRRKHSESPRDRSSRVSFTRFTDSEWNEARKAFAKARKKRKELEEARLSDSPTAKLAKQAAAAERQEAEAYQRIIAWGEAEMAAFERQLTAKRDIENWQAFQADLALFYERQRLLLEEEEIIVMLLVS